MKPISATVKKTMAFLLCFVLTFTLVPSLAFAEPELQGENPVVVSDAPEEASGDAQSSEHHEAEDAADVSNTPEPQSEAPEGAMDEASALAAPMELASLSAGPDDLSVSATLSGLDGSVALNASGASYDTSGMNGFVTPQTLDILAKFSSGNDFTERSIKVHFGHGLTLASVPTLEQLNASGDLQGKVAAVTWDKDPDIDFGAYAASPGSGTLTLVLKDPEETGAIVSAPLSLSVKLASGFLGNGGSRSYQNALKVEATQKNASGEAQSTGADALVLDSYTISGSNTYVRPFISYGGTGNTYMAKPGQRIALPYSVSYSNEGPFAQYDTAPTFYKSATLVFRLPKGVSLEPLFDPDTFEYHSPITFPQDSRLTGAQLDGSGGNAINSVKGSDGVTYITIKLNQFTAVNGQVVDFYLNVKVDDTATDQSYRVDFMSDDSTFVPYEAPEAAGKPTGQSKVITVSRQSPTLSVAQNAVYGDLSRQYVSPSEMLPGQNTFLTGACIKNPSAEKTGKLGLKIDFPQAILARAIWLPVGPGDGADEKKAMNLSVTLSDDSALGAPANPWNLDTAYQSSNNGLDSRVLLNLDQLGVDQTLGIKSLSYELSGILPGTSADGGNITSSPLSVYGRYADTFVSDYGINYSVRNGGLTEGGASWSAPVTITTKLQSADTPGKLLSHISGVTLTPASPSLTAGSTVSVKATINTGNYHYGYDGWTTYWKGHELYIREAGLLAIDKNSITVIQQPGGAVLQASAEELQDNTGGRVWRVRIPEGVISVGTGDTHALPTRYVSVSYELKVRADASSKTLSWSDMLFTRPMPSASGKQVLIPDANKLGSYSRYVRKNDFNVTGDDQAKALNIATPSIDATTAIVKATDFRVSTSARLEISPSYDSGDRVYDGENALPLNQYGQVSYKVSAINNTMTPTDPGAFTIHIPIPKQGALASDWGGQNVGGTGKNAVFDFNTALKEAVDAGGISGAQVSYSTSYVPDVKDASSFVAWNLIADKKDIKTVRVVCAGQIPAGAAQSITMKLDLLDADGNAANAQTNPGRLTAFAGKQAIYSAKYGVKAGALEAVNAPSAPVGVVLHTGIIRGFVYDDLNKNDAYDQASDTPRAGVQIKLWKDASYSQSFGDPIFTDQNGLFTVMGANNGQDVYIEVVNPSSTDGLRFVKSYATALTSLKLGKVKPGSSLDWADYKPEGYAPGKLIIGLGAPYEVQFRGDGSPSNMPATQYVYTGGKPTRPQETPQRPGYSFVNWYEWALPMTTLFDFDQRINGNTVIYAKFTEDYRDMSYWAQITYDANDADDGSVPASSSYLAKGNTASIAANTGSLVRKGYYFSGWSTERDAAAGTSYNAGGTWTNIPAGTHTLYAKWTPRTVDVSFVSNGGSALPPVTGLYGKTIASSAAPQEPVQAGYTFAGWYTDAGLSSLFSFGDAGTPLTAEEGVQDAAQMTGEGHAALTLYAKWVEKAVTVDFYRNWNENDDVVHSTQTSQYGDLIGAPSDPTLDSAWNGSKEFAGWYTERTGGLPWTFASDRIAADGGTLCIYAQYADKPVIYFDKNASDAVAGSESYREVESGVAVGDLPGEGQAADKAPSRLGYTLLGWSTNSSDQSANFHSSSSVTEPSTRLYAVWTPKIIWTVTYIYLGNILYTDQNASDVVDSGVSYNRGTYDRELENSLQYAPTRAGYTFTGWNTQPDGSGTFWRHHSDGNATLLTAANGVLGADTASPTLTLYATWTADYTEASYWVNVSYEGGLKTSGTVPEDQHFEAGTQESLAGNTGSLERTGYTFTGWNTQPDGGGTSYAAGIDASSLSAGNYTLYPEWSADYTDSYWASISYGSNGADGGFVPATQREPAGASVTLAGNIGSLVRTGYTFTGWNTQADGLGTHYSEGEPYLAPSGTTALYAEWTPDYSAMTYWASISYSANGANTGNAPGVSYHAGGSAAHLAENSGSDALARDGYLFTGWNMQADGAGTDYAAGDYWQSIPAGLHTLYAKWTVDNTSSYWKQVRFTAGTGGSLDDGESLQQSILYSGIASGTLWESSLITLPVPTPQDEHHSFVSWSPALPDADWPITADAEYTALFVIDEHSISYVSTGHSSGDAPETQSAAHGEQLNVLGQGTLQRTGYRFAGWSLTPGTAATHGEGALITMEQDVTLYAVWRLDESLLRTLSYAPGADASEVSGLPGKVSGLRQGLWITLGAAPARTGYSFIGWAASNGGFYQAGSSYIMPNQDVTLTALWKQNGGGATPDAPTTPAKPKPPAGGGTGGGTPTTPAAPPEQQTPPAQPEPASDSSSAAETKETADGTYTKGGAQITDTLREQLHEAALAQMERQTGNPLKDILSGSVPLGTLSLHGARSIASLFAATLALLIALAVAGTMLVRRFREDRMPLFGILALGTGLLAVLLCAAFEGSDAPFVWTTSYTLPVVLALVVQITMTLSWVLAHKSGLERKLLEK